MPSTADFVKGHQTTPTVIAAVPAQQESFSPLEQGFLGHSLDSFGCLCGIKMKGFKIGIGWSLTLTE